MTENFMTDSNSFRFWIKLHYSGETMEEAGAGNMVWAKHCRGKRSVCLGFVKS